MSLLRILNGPSGKGSVTRAVAVYVPFTIITTWAIVSLWKLDLQSLDSNLVALIAVSMLPKLAEKWLEQVRPSAPSVP